MISKRIEKGKFKIPNLVYLRKQGQLMLIIDGDSFKIEFHSLDTDSEIKYKYQEMLFAKEGF